MDFTSNLSNGLEHYPRAGKARVEQSTELGVALWRKKDNYLEYEAVPPFNKGHYRLQ